MNQWDYKIDQPMPGPFPFPNSRKGPGVEVGVGVNGASMFIREGDSVSTCHKKANICLLFGSEQVSRDILPEYFSCIMLLMHMSLGRTRLISRAFTLFDSTFLFFESILDTATIIA